MQPLLRAEKEKNKMWYYEYDKDSSDAFDWPDFDDSNGDYDEIDAEIDLLLAEKQEETHE